MVKTNKKNVNINNNAAKQKRKNRSPAQKNRQQGQQGKSFNTAPLAYNTINRGRPAKTTMSGGATVVSHREVVSASVVAGPEYGVNMVLAIQPGINVYSKGSPLGNWLPEIATQYDNYEFTTLKIHYIPTCATTKDGLVMLAFEPNPDDLAPVDFTSFKNAGRSIDGPVREPLTLDMSDKVRRRLLVRSANVSALPLYDAGKIYVATLNGNSTTTGYLEVEYTVKFYNPQTNSGTNPVLYSEVYPTYKVTYNSGSTLSRAFGRTDGGRDHTWLMADLAGAAASGGGLGDNSLISFDKHPAIGVAIASLVKNGFYSINAGNYPYGFRFKYKGTYRVSWNIGGNWMDYVPFRAMLGILNVDGSINDSQYKVPTAAGGEAILPSDGTSVRGFSVPLNTGVDMPLVGSTLVTVDDVLKLYSLSIGVWQYAAVTEADTATFIYTPENDRPWFKVEWINALTAYI